MNRCCVDVRTIWKEVRDFWLKEKTSGKDLYHYATQRAADLGWRLCLEQANGHRIADFPHAVRNRGSIEEYKERPSPDRWILEIQIRHHTLPFGAFYEDLL
jgi:hypothetical protein